MRIKDVRLSILRTELAQKVIPTQGAVDKLPQLVLVSVLTEEGVDGHYISYLIPSLHRRPSPTQLKSLAAFWSGEIPTMWAR